MFQVAPIVDSGKLKETQLYGVCLVQELQRNPLIPPCRPPRMSSLNAS